MSLHTIIAITKSSSIIHEQITQNHTINQPICAKTLSTHTRQTFESKYNLPMYYVTQFQKDIS